MRGRLRNIRNWADLAGTTGYSVKALAEHTGCSVRQVERFFIKTTGRSPHAYLRELRMRRAVELLKECSQVKEVASLLSYKQVGHFSREFRRTFGVPPSLIRDPLPPAAGEESCLDNKSRV